MLTEGDGLGLTADVGARTTATAEPGPDPRPRHGFRWTTHLAVWTLQLPIALFFANSEAWRVGWSVSERFPRSGPSPWLVFACLSLMLVAIATHEAGHRLALVSVGRPSSMLIAPLGGMVRADDGLAVTATVAAAGPVASLGLAATAWAVAHGVTGFAPTTGALLQFLAWFSALIGIANLVPVFPLDGGQVVAALLRRVPERPRVLVACGHKAFSVALAATVLCLQMAHLEHWVLAWDAFLMGAIAAVAALALVIEFDAAHHLGIARFAYRWILIGVSAGFAVGWWLLAPVILPT